MSDLAIGTSGWNYGHWRGRFYPNDLPSSQWLSFYGRHFRTVEVNVTFYRTPRGDDGAHVGGGDAGGFRLLG